MSDLSNEEKWVWVIVQDPEGNEQFLGQVDESEGISFIPVFLEKDDAMLCLGRMAREKGKKYETQAITLKDIRYNASEKGFSVFLLNSEGEPLEKFQ
jgi:hypothetical protein